MPYLFPPTPQVIPNGSLHELSLHGLFGQLHRPADAKQIDIQMVVPPPSAPRCLPCSGEAKNYAEDLQATMLGQCMRKIPPDSMVHFIFCRSVSRTCFAKGFPKGKDLRHIVVLVVATDPKHPTKCRLDYLNKHCPRKTSSWTTWRTAVIIPVDELPGGQAIGSQGGAGGS